MLCPDCGKKARTASSRCDRCGTWLIALDLPGQERDPFIGKSIDNRFIITELIARGGMGAVYKAYQASIDRHIVVKVMQPRLVQRQDAIQRFFREAKAASRLNHHNIVQIYDFGQAEDGLLYMMMEYLDGTLLYELMSWGPISPARTINILAQVCDALTVAHENGVIHRDLKPENIFLLDRAGATDFVKVFDFGIAKMASTPTDPGQEIASDPSIFGTPHYMSPEQALAQPVDLRTDLYALGIILFEMLSGAHPFDSDDPITLLRQHLSDALPPLTTSCPDFVLPPEIDDVFARLVAKNAGQRPASARATKDLLLGVFADISGHGYTTTNRSGQKQSQAHCTVELESAVPVHAGDRESEYVEITTHELRTALTVVSSGVELLVDGVLGDLTQKQEQFLRMIKRNIDRMSRFSTNMLALSRLDTNRYNLNLNEVSLKAALDLLLLRLQQEADEKQIILKLHRIDPELKVVADPEALSLVVSNLISNVLLSQSGVTRADVGCRARDEYFVETWISDDGPGIPEEELDSLFDRLRGAGGEYRGAGIRLAVCKALVEKMEGRITVDSKPGRGTTLRFRLPTPAATRVFLFGQIAVLAGHVEPGRLEEAVAAQMSSSVDERKRLGKILIKRGEMSRRQVVDVLNIQKARMNKHHRHLPVSLADGLFGQLASKYGYVSRQQLHLCVSLQEASREWGEPLRLGQVMVEQEQMNPDEVLKVLKMQKIHIAACTACCTRYNVVRRSGAKQQRCPACDRELEVLTSPEFVSVEKDLIPE